MINSIQTWSIDEKDPNSLVCKVAKYYNVPADYRSNEIFFYCAEFACNAKNCLYLSKINVIPFNEIYFSLNPNYTHYRIEIGGSNYYFDDGINSNSAFLLKKIADILYNHKLYEMKNQ